MRRALILMVLMAANAQAGVVERYLEAYFEMYPSRATAAGMHDRDDLLEDFSAAKLSEWVSFNVGVVEELRTALAGSEMAFEDRLDAELLLREAELQVLDLARLERPQKDPLFWTGVVSQATVFLLVREDLPREVRLTAVASRAQQIPRLAAQARASLTATDPSAISPDLCQLASGQARASSQFYAEGLAAATQDEDDPQLRQRLATAGEQAGRALSDLAGFLEELGEKATGSARLGEDYRPRFEIVNGMTTALDEVSNGAKRDLAAKVSETAEFGRSVWTEVMGDEEPPADDKLLVQALFARISEDRASSVDEFIADYRRLVDESVAFVRQREIITLPEPLDPFRRTVARFLYRSVGWRGLSSGTVCRCGQQNSPLSTDPIGRCLRGAARGLLPRLQPSL